MPVNQPTVQAERVPPLCPGGCGATRLGIQEGVTHYRCGTRVRFDGDKPKVTRTNGCISGSDGRCMTCATKEDVRWGLCWVCRHLGLQARALEPNLTGSNLEERGIAAMKPE